MADNCYYWMNGLLNVDYFKIETNTDLTMTEALNKANKIQTSTTLYKNFSETDVIKSDGGTSYASIHAKYFSPEADISGAKFTIYRKTPDQKYYDYVCTLSDGDYSFLDYNIVNNQYYHYLAWVEVFVTDEITEYTCYEDREDEGDIKYIATTFDRWCICDIEESNEEGVYNKIGNMWSLGLNMDDPELNHNLSITTWDTLGQYGKVSMGKKDYTSSSFTGLLGDIKEYTYYEVPSHGEYINLNPSTPKEKDSLSDAVKLIIKNGKQVYQYTEKMDFSSAYARETEKLKAWKEFCANGNLKLLRDLKGNSWIVQIVDSPKATINQGTNISQTVINFSWQEIEDVNDFSIIKILE